MIGTYVPPRRTPFTPLELAQAYELALGGDSNVKAGLVAVLMAHCALETGRDTSRGLIGPSCWNFNLGNVKASPSWQGLYTCITLNEVLLRNGKRRTIWFAPGGELVGMPGSAIVPGTEHVTPPGHPQTRMRAHVSLEEGIRAKLQFLQAPRFREAMAAATRGDAAGYVDAIHAQRYFTADLLPYRNAVVSLYRSYLPIAGKIALEPVRLPEPVEMKLASDIGKVIRVLPIQLEPDWNAMRADRDKEIREA